MERNFLVLGVAASLLLAGCAASGVPGASPTTDGAAPEDGTATEGGTPDAPPSTEPTTASTNGTSCPPPANYSTRALPDRPANLDEASVAAFVKRYEEAVTWNRLVEDPKISLGLGVTRTTVVNRTGKGYVVRVEGGFGFEDCLDGSHVAGNEIIRANYFVNGTTVVRLNMPEDRTTDPRENGTVVERWGEDDPTMAP